MPDSVNHPSTDPLTDLVDARLAWAPRQVRRWYEERRHRELLGEAMAAQAGWIGDTQFGAQFRDGVAVVDVPEAAAWANRVVSVPAHTPGECAGTGATPWCVTGIRFRGMDVTRPFVDVVATSLPPTAESLARIAEVVLPLYAGFAPRALRVDAPDPDALVDGVRAHPRLGAAVVDQYLVAGPIARLRQGGRRDTGVSLRPVGDVSDAADRVAGWYAELARRRPQTADWARPATAEELAECAGEHLAFDVLVEGRRAGLVAGHRENDHGLAGFVVTEIVLDEAHRGRRHAASVLRAFLEQVPADPGDVLWGTIHPDNHASLANARSVGRSVVGGYVWFRPRVGGEPDRGRLC